jgi:tetratricopeptide (TPR) repeat protein
MNRGLQNLGARYNYIYNSNVILNNYEEELHQDYADNYNEILPVYTAPEKFSASAANPVPVNEKALDAIIIKAKAVIAEKTLSNYIDESYLLLGKAFYFKANYFIAQEYFHYAAKTYPDKPDIYLSALNWKARSLMQLNNLNDAARVLDTVYHNLTLTNVNTAEPMATITQMFIYQDKIDEAVPLLEKAIKETHLKRNRIRWTYILAQLYEMQKKYPEALQNYTRVQKSNAAFELYFNANLNSIKINGLLKGEKLDYKRQLLALLRDDKNLDYTDQVYFQVAQRYADEGNYTEAEKYDQLSVQSSYKNKYQKGLSYLNIADLNFKNLHNFLKAKSYYDSAINTLPKSYSGYEQIVKKTRNLEYLTRRYEIIAMEDTLQMLAVLPENERADKIKSILKPPAPAVAGADKTGNQSLSNPGNPFPASGSNAAQETTGSFYFANSTAVSRGYSDFLIRWGNRKLEDNWRQSVKSSAQTTAESIAKVEDGPLPANGNIKATVNNEEAVGQYLKAVPVNPDLLALSNQRIIDAYYDIASFYQQELNDQQEALRIYQLVLARFPENNRLAAIYYSMYLGYKNNDPGNAEKYKALVLTKFPSGSYAKTILDPDFSVKQSAEQAAVIQRYNTVFDQYEQKAFPQVITTASALTSAYPENEFSPQLSYLQAIAIGRTQPVDSLIGAFKMISKNYPGDRLIVPLVNDHLAYLAAHMDDFKNRKIALPDFDASEPRFFAVAEKVKPAPVQQTEPAAEIKPGDVKLPETIKPKDAAVTANSLFSTALSQVYYYVIDVADATLTLSSSRFGIGQFNRGNYADSDLRHRLSEFDNDQLIYVGNFSSFAEVKSYADGINPQLKQIMKVPASLYSSFIISKENFEKLQSKDLVNRYLEFYKNNYEK